MEKRKFYLNENIDYLVNKNEYILISTELSISDDFGFQTLYWNFTNQGNDLSIKYYDLCYKNLASNEHFKRAYKLQ